MATKTQYYNLDKPSYDEVADIEVINANFDKIDQQMRNNADGVNFAEAISSDAYDNSKSYAVGDYCIYNNKLYRCITAIESAEAFNIAKWEQTTVGNEVNQLNSNLGNISELPYPTYPVVNNVNQIYLDLQLTKKELNNTNTALIGVRNLHFRYKKDISIEGNGNWLVNAFDGFQDISLNKIAYVGISMSAYNGTRPDVLWNTYNNNNQILVQNNSGYVYWNMLVIYTD